MAIGRGARLAHRFADLRVAMAQNQWPKTLAEIDVCDALYRSKRRALRTAKEDRVAADAFESAHRTMHAAGCDAARPFKVLLMECTGRSERRRRFGCCTQGLSNDGKPKRCRRFALPPHSKLDSQTLRVTRAISDDVLGAGALEHMPGFQQRLFKFNQTLFGQQHEAGILTADLVGAHLPPGRLVNRLDQIN